MWQTLHLHLTSIMFLWCTGALVLPLNKAALPAGLSSAAALPPKSQLQDNFLALLTHSLQVTGASTAVALVPGARLARPAHWQSIRYDCTAHALHFNLLHRCKDVCFQLHTYGLSIHGALYETILTWRHSKHIFMNDADEADVLALRCPTQATSLACCQRCQRAMPPHVHWLLHYQLLSHLLQL